MDKIISTYLISPDQNFISWSIENKKIVFNDIVNSIVYALNFDEITYPIIVANIISNSITTKFVVKSHEASIESLSKALDFYVEEEMYENAAICRDALEKIKTSND